MEPEGTHWLVSLDAHANGKRVRLPSNAPLLVGRGEHNHLVLDDYRISRQHSRVAPEKEGYVVYDLNSVNGTHVNGVPVRRHVLRMGDELRFGPFSYRFEFQTDTSTEKNAGATTGRRKPGEIWRPVESVTRMWRDDIHKVPTSSSSAISSLGAGGYQAKLPDVDLNRLEDAHTNLGILYKFVQAISTTIEKTGLLDLLAAQVLDIFPNAISVSIYLRDKPELPFELASFHGGEWAKAPFTPAVARAGRAIFEAGSEKDRGTTMYAPMMDRGVALGVICVAADPRGDGFTKANLELLDGMTAPATIALQNTRMHEDALARERLRRDLELAAQIQQSFLPRETISVDGVEFLAAYRAAYAIGGDFYDIFWVTPEKLAVFVGDISGKGISAALLMARISGELRVAALAHIDPVEVFTIMNKAIIGRNQPELFFTAIYLTLDVRKGEVVLVNAGHPTPYICHANGDVEAVTGGSSTAVGMFDEPMFTSTRIHIDDGASLVLYTDGVVEAADASGALYGDERLERCLNGVGSFPPDISSSILASVEKFANKTAPSDDLTIFICHRNVSKGVSLQPRRFSNTTEETMRPPPPPPMRASSPTITDMEDEPAPITARR